MNSDKATADNNMRSDKTADLEDRLTNMLPGRAQVKISGIASLGAQRQTLFLDITQDGTTIKAVAQIAGNALASNSVRDEARLLVAAEKAGVIVPRILASDPDSGTIISEHVAGESIPRRILRLVEANQELGSKLASDSGNALSLIHQIPTDEYRDLQDFSDPDRYADEMENLLNSLPTPRPTFRLGVRWLRENRPPTCAETKVVHGDFRLGNFLASESGITAVLDWELVHLGDPMEDLAWLCLRTWRFGRDDQPVGGFGSMAALRNAYEAADGEWREEAFHWWTVARTLWWGLGLARQAQAFLDGATTSIVLAASGRRVVELEYDLLRLIED